jgi:hypothetical protein
MQTGISWKRSARGLWLIGLLAAAISPCCAEEKPLLQRAAKVADVSNWDAVFPVDYYWLSDHEVLFTRRVPVGTEPDTRTIAFRINLLTGAKKPIPPPCPLVFNIRLSPDRTWLLMDCREDAGTWIAAKLDGSHRVTWRSDDRSLSIPIWTQDSRHWVDFLADKPGPFPISMKLLVGAVRVYDAQDPGAVSTSPTFPLSAKEPTISQMRACLYRANDVLIRDEAHCLTVEAISAYDGRSASIRAAEMDLRSPGSPIRSVSVRLPSSAKTASICEVLLSPEGKYVAYKLRRQERKSQAKRSSGRMEWWISPLNGGMPHMVGYMDDSSHQIPEPANVKWLPDKKHLSFFYQGALWTVPVID